MRKFLLLILAILVLVSPVFFYFFRQSAPVRQSDKLKVVTTLFPLYDMARSIGADKAEVSLLLPPGVEPHGFEPTPSDILAINEADIFIYTGRFMEPWVEDILKSVDQNKVLVVNASQGIKLISAMSSFAEPTAGSVDPHIWMDLGNAEVMVGNIGQAFEQKDTADKNLFAKNTDDYKKQLTKIDEEYKTGLANCHTKTIVYAGHYALGYMAKRYGLNYVAAQGLAPDAEPTAQDLINLVNQVKNDKIKYIFYEELSSPKIAQTLSQETSAKLLLLSAAHNISKEQLQSGRTFFDILYSNLVNLRQGLQCQ